MYPERDSPCGASCTVMLPAGSGGFWRHHHQAQPCSPPTQLSSSPTMPPGMDEQKNQAKLYRETKTQRWASSASSCPQCTRKAPSGAQPFSPPFSQKLCAQALWFLALLGSPFTTRMWAHVLRWPQPVFGVRLPERTNALLLWCQSYF